MDIDTLEQLSKCPLFKNIPQEDIIQLMHLTHYRVIRYRKGEIVALSGTICQHADIIISGEMTAHLIGPSNRSLRITLHHAGNMLAPAFLFAMDNFYPVTVETTTSSQIVRLLPQDLELLIETDKRVAMNFIRILSNIIAHLTKRIAYLSMSVREKVCCYLKEEQKRQQNNLIVLKMSRTELAEQFGIQKYSLQRCLSELQKEGTIQVNGKQIQILKRIQI